MVVKMWSREAATRTPHLVYVVVVALVISGCCVRTIGQHLPSRDELDFQLHRKHPEIFYDTKLLPDGAEVTSYVLKRVSSRYFFLVDVGNVPLTISVTPCSSVVSTTILWRTMPDDEEYYYYDDDDRIAHDIEEPDELWQQASAGRRGAPESTDAVLMSTRRSDRMTYHNRSAAAGLYSVVVVASRRDTSLRLYASTTPHSDAVYPPLPADTVVRVTGVTRDEISFAWKPPTAATATTAVRFCVSVSSLRHFRSQCAAHAHRHGDRRPPPPPYAGFGFARERRGRRRGPNRRRRTQSTAAPETTTARPEVDDSVYACVGTDTNYTYRPTAGRKYYIDVYAINTATNASLAYHGATVRAARGRSAKSSGRLVDGRSSRVVLKTSRPERRLKYQVAGRAAVTRNIYVRSCEVPPQTAVRVQLERESDGEVLATRVVDKSFEKALSVSSLAPGPYRVKISTADGARPPRGRRYRWKVLVSTGDRSPYPQLPADARVRLSSVDCRSATVTWSLPTPDGASLPQRYCVHVQPATSAAAFDACSGPRRRRKSVKVSCHVTGTAQRGGGNATMVQTISGMKSGRRYAVDVFASTTTTRRTKEFLVYDRLVVDVPSTC